METRNLAQDALSESEAAQWLGITVESLHKLLDDHIFNNGARRPDDIRFTHADLLMLSYWCGPSKRKVLSMPRRIR